MANDNDSNNIPIILDGKFFKIISRNGDSVVARCVNCINKELSGSMKATSNYVCKRNSRLFNLGEMSCFNQQPT